MPFPGSTVIAAIASGVLLFILPGALLVRASGARLPRAELPAWALAGSLAVLFVCFAGIAALGLPLQAALWPLAAIVALAAARRPATSAGATSYEASTLRDDGEPRWWPLFLLIVIAAAALAASSFASVGSIDRWWYLAYVRGYLESDALRVTEPFLGTERVFARFGVHPWLMGLALWSKLSGADPVWLYERVAPVLAVVAAISATTALARALFGRSSVARAAVFATLLSWSGGLLPVLARAGEDKVLAQAALACLCLAACLNAVRGERGALAMAAIAAIATATVHGLVFAFVLAAWLPFALLRRIGAVAERRALAATSVLLLVVAVQPAVLGLMVERSLVEAGAVADSDDHPVLRVHESRDRTIDAGSLGFIVNPRLLAHPLSLLALGAVPLLLRRRRDLSSDFLLASTATSLLVAFLPPLPALAGKLIPGWMVYRVLWILPLGPLAALGAAKIGRHLRASEKAILGLLLALSALPLAGSIEQRVGENRARRALPSSAEFSAAMRAVAALPANALVAAAPQLSERLPALTGRHVVAALDRSTIMFSGSRDLGEARLRLRAATLCGDVRAGDFPLPDVLRPTHALFDPRAAAQPVCAQRLFGNSRYALCSLAEAQAETPALSLERVNERAAAASPSLPAGARATTRIFARGGAASSCKASCTPGASDDLAAACQPGDWDAAAPVVECRIECSAFVEAAAVDIDEVEIVPQSVHAVDELLLRARGLRQGREVYVATGRARTDGLAPLRFALPHTVSAAADTVELRIASGMLPFVKLRDVTWSVAESTGSAGR